MTASPLSRWLTGPVPSRMMAAVRSRPARWAFGLGAAGLAVWAVAAEWQAVRDALGRLDAYVLLVALLATAGNVLLAGVVWRTVLADLGSPVPLPAAARIFFVGQLGKYVPGSVWPLVVQTELGRDHHVPRRRTATATMVSLLLAVLSALLVVLVAAPLAPGVLPPGLGWAALLVIPLLAVLHPAVVAAGVDRLLRLLGRERLERRTTVRGTALATLWAAASWACAGLQVFVLAVALGAAADIRTAALAVGGYALAWAVGFVVVVMPAGAGAREVALAAVLAGVLDRGEVVVVVLVSRVLFTAVDLAAAGLGVAAARRHARTAA